MLGYRFCPQKEVVLWRKGVSEKNSPQKGVFCGQSQCHSRFGNGKWPNRAQSVVMELLVNFTATVNSIIS